MSLIKSDVSRLTSNFRMQSMAHLIEIRDLKKIYAQGEEPVHALDGVSIDIDEGEFVAIMGASGSGKSTMLNDQWG